MSNRVYVPFTLFNLRIVNMQHLWTPSTEYRGQPTQKPNFFGTCILDRTQQNWWDEPALAPAALAYNELVTKSGMQWGHISEWPVKDGNMPPEPGKPPSEWAKNRWIIGGSSSNPIKIEIAKPNGSVEALTAKVGVKPGDYVALGLSAAIKQNNPRAVKNYCNTVLFMGAGEEIAVGQSVTGAELMAQAQRQGLQVAGFQPSTPQGWQPQAQPGYGAPPAGFPSHGQPNPGGYAPTPGGPAFSPATGPSGPAGGNTAYPSSAPAGAPPFNPNSGAPMGGYVPQGAPAPMQQPQTAGYPSNPQPGGPAPAFQPAPGNPGYAVHPHGTQPGAPAQQWQAPPNFAGPAGAPGGWTPPQ